MADRALLERVWEGSDLVARTGRLVLSPFAAVYGAAAALRGWLYDLNALHPTRGALPALSVGNLTVGGTGKTPLAAWFAAELRARGARPAIVLRDYGRDEPLVHERLNPGVPVIASADRVAGMVRAAAAGADVAVLDDAFQHRRVFRDTDVVLVSADRWTRRRWLLPAGPFREPLRALQRASLVVITHRACSTERLEAVRQTLERRAPVPVATVRLGLGELHSAAGDGDAPVAPVEALSGQPVLAVAAVGDPRSFVQQLEQLGALVTARIFPDHYRFTSADAMRLANAAPPRARVVCTLKDAVKLAPLWPRAASPLWYVSQHAILESGRSAIDQALATVLDARTSHP